MLKAFNTLSVTIAILVGFIFGLPHLLIPIFLGSGVSYTPLVAGLDNVCGITHDEALFYGAQIKKIFDGKPFFADVDLYEYRNVSNPFSTFPYFVFGNIAKLLGSVQRLFILADFILPPLIFYSIYLLLLSLTGEMVVSVFGSIFLIFGPDIFRAISAVLKTYSGYSYAFWNFPLNNPFSFSRFISPEFNLPILFFSLYFIYQGMKKYSYFYSAISGIFLGLLFHSYLYFWTFYLSGSLALLFLYAFKKDFKKVKIILLAVMIGAIISIPYFLKQIEFNKFINHNDILLRFGLVRGSFVEWYHTIEGFVALLILIIFCKKRDEGFYFLLAFMFGGIMCLNQQILTGKTIQNHHWYFLTIQPWFVFILSYLLSSVVKKSERQNLLKRLNISLILKVLIIFLLSSGLIKQTVYAERTYNTYSLTEEEKALFTWLKEKSKTDDVVLSLNRRLDDLIPVYTKNFVFLPNGVLTFASDKEIIERLIIAFKLYGVKEEYLKENLPRDEWGFHLFHTKYAQVFYGKREVFPKEVLSDILAKYRLLSSNSFYNNFKKYKLDYIYLGTYERGISKKDFGDHLALKEVFNKNGNRLYKVEFKDR